MIAKYNFGGSLKWRMCVLAISFVGEGFKREINIIFLRSNVILTVFHCEIKCFAQWNLSDKIGNFHKGASINIFHYLKYLWLF